MSKYVKSFVLLIVIYMVLLFAVTLLGGEGLEENVKNSLTYLEEEGTYPTPLFNSLSGRLDNYTDKIILNNMIVDENQDILTAMMKRGGRVQYWHGYLVLFKPLLMLGDIYFAREILNGVFFIVLFAVFWLMAKKLNLWYAFSIVISMLFVKMTIVSVSMQFISCFMVSLLAMMGVLVFYTKENLDKAGIFLFVVGSAINFVDFLTVPIITLGYPLIVLLLIRTENRKRYATKKELLYVIRMSIAWGMGYGLTWITKWILGSVLLQENAVAGALDTAKFRVSGSAEYALNRVEMLRNNWETFLTEGNVVIAIGVVIVAIVFMCLRRRKGISLLKAIPVFCIGFYPFIWNMFMANHSQVHFWFTYRSQSIFLFAILTGGYVLLFQNKTEVRNE